METTTKHGTRRGCTESKDEENALFKTKATTEQTLTSVFTLHFSLALPSEKANKNVS